LRQRIRVRATELKSAHTILSSIQEVKARNGIVIAIADEGDETIAGLADDVISIPAADKLISPVIAAVPLQLLAYHMGIMKGNDVDKPRNLAKSVTVE
jgi:glucosamine--fructose-6-phosphate aminotransferase (isomerizing)